MDKYILFLAILLGVTPMVVLATEDVVYGYDKSNNKIYAKVGNTKATLNFEEDYTGNPAYVFDFFYGLPAIIADSRSLHDLTTYAILNYREKKFNIDCIYYEIKSKQNGLFLKEGICGLNEINVGNYQDIINEKTSDVVSDMDSVDTSLLLNGKVTYLPIVINKNKEQTVYKFYADKKSLLDDKYSIVSVNKNLCEVYENNPWVVYNNNSLGGVQILSGGDGRQRLVPATPSVKSKRICSTYPAVTVKVPKAFLYDAKKNVKKAYLIKGDSLNVLSVSNDEQWCNIKYLNHKNKPIESIVQCQNLDLFK